MLSHYGCGFNPELRGTNYITFSALELSVVLSSTTEHAVS